MKIRYTLRLRGLTSLVFFLFAINANVVAQNENNFYTETIDNYTSEVNLRTAYDVNGNGNTTDTERLQQAIDDVNASGGGIIYLPLGKYLLANVKIKSNVHLKIQSGSEIECFINGNTKAVTTFSIGGGEYVENVSVRGVGGSYNITTFNSEGGSRAFGMGNVNNFLIQDFICDDAFSKFSSMEFTLTKMDGEYVDGAFPNNGIVKNCQSINARYGYGFVQIQAATNVLFKNIDGDGGAVLRCETGWVLMNDLQIGGIRQIYGRNITGRNGKCAVMISPHSMHNGLVDIEGVKSYSCSYGVTIDGGYIADRQTNPDLTPGTFSSVSVRNISAEFGTTAQIKAKDLNWIPYYRRDLLTGVSEDEGESQIGPAIAAVRFDEHNYKDNVSVGTITACGFGCQTDIVNQDDKNNTLDCDNPDYSSGCIDNAPAAAIPGKIQAEGYSDMKGIQTQVTTDTGAGENVGWIGTGDWMDYEVNVTSAGTYNVDFRVASLSNNIKFNLTQGTTVLASVDATTTSGWQNWKTVTARVNLAAGAQILRVLATGGGWNFNWMDFSAGTTAPIGSYISLKAVNGNFVVAEKNITDNPVFSNRTSVGSWEKFQVVDAGGGLIALKANANDNYLTVRTDLSAASVQATATTIGENEKFTWEELSPTTVALLANANGNYLWCQNNVEKDPIRAKGTTTGGWSTFTFALTELSKTSNIKTVNDKAIKIYPVPMTDMVHFSAQDTIREVNIYDTMGRVVLRTKGTAITFLNVSVLKTGVYIMEMVTHTGRFTKRVSK